MRVFDGGQKLDETSLNKLFLKQLDNIYCIKKQLLKILPSLANTASFPGLKTAITENLDQIKMQILRMDVIYKIYKAKYSEENCIGIKTISFEAYLSQNNSNLPDVERDLALLFHLHIIEGMETAYFNILKRIASNLENKDIEVLLEQNFETSVKNIKLYELIEKEYISWIAAPYIDNSYIAITKH